jgi:hypothetical protein
VYSQISEHFLQNSLNQKSVVTNRVGSALMSKVEDVRTVKEEE